VYVINATVTISNNRAFSNTAAIGGGLYLLSSDATLSGNTVLSNTASDGGGGVFLHSSSAATFSGNTVAANAANYNGGGVFLYMGSAATLNGNIVISNTAGQRGGGLFVHFSDATLTNNVVADNRANVAGSGLHIRACSPRLLHTTIARNTGGDGSGVHVDDWSGTHSTAAFTNTIIYSHTVGITVTAGNTATLNATLWHANGTERGGAGVINHTNDRSGDPLFAADGYHLTLTSAAVDRGVNAGVTSDVDGDPRPLGGKYDLGADEFPVKRIYLPLVLRGS
jgi:parallel beta-helix repeat protein